jgi:hypothetical protein
MACATGGTAGGAKGVGATMVAPGDPLPGVSGTEAVDCGETRLRICAKACGETKRKTPIAAPATAARRKIAKPHPDIAIFLDLNHGNFKPPSPGRAFPGMLGGLRYLADSPSLSPYRDVHLVGHFATADDGSAPPSVMIMDAARDARIW